MCPKVLLSMKNKKRFLKKIVVRQYPNKYLIVSEKVIIFSKQFYPKAAPSKGLSSVSFCKEASVIQRLFEEQEAKFSLRKIYMLPNRT